MLASTTGSYIKMPLRWYLTGSTAQMLDGPMVYQDRISRRLAESFLGPPVPPVSRSDQGSGSHWEGEWLHSELWGGGCRLPCVSSR